MKASQSRKEAIRAFKERKVPRGVFAVRCTATGRVWVDSSPNLDAAPNGLWFALRSGSHRNKALQEEWNAHGKVAFQFQILETLDDDTPAIGVSDLLKEKRRHWLVECGAQPLY